MAIALLVLLLAVVAFQFLVAFTAGAWLGVLVWGIPMVVAARCLVGWARSTA